MHCHLVAVEVRVEWSADKRRNFNRSALDKHGLERLNGKAVQRGRTVQKNGMLLNDFFKDVPNEVLALFHSALCALDIVALARFDEPLHNEGLEELDRHLFGKSALEDLQIGSYDDNRTAGVVDALSEKVLTETPLLTAEKSGQRFQFAVRGTG